MKIMVQAVDDGSETGLDSEGRSCLLCNVGPSKT